jgi:hypothetical protein
MLTSRSKDFIAAFIAAAVGCLIFFAVHRHDEQVMRTIRPFTGQYDSGAFRPTPEEQRVALQFSDTTLPQLTALGLITQYTRSDAETVITVNGSIWKERSAFFHESLLEQISIYNTVHRFALRTRIIDDRTDQLYAEVTSSGRRMIY